MGKIVIGILKATKRNCQKFIHSNDPLLVRFILLDKTKAAELIAKCQVCLGSLRIEIQMFGKAYRNIAMEQSRT